MGLIDGKIEGLIYGVNNYRVAQAHIKRNDPLREPSKENLDKFQRISTEAHSKLASKIMMTDAGLKERVAEIVEQKTD